MICGDEWDAPRLSGASRKNWGIFLESLNCERSTANKLLDFAGYKERGGILSINCFVDAHSCQSEKSLGSWWYRG